MGLQPELGTSKGAMGNPVTPYICLGVKSGFLGKYAINQSAHSSFTILEATGAKNESKTEAHRLADDL